MCVRRMTVEEVELHWNRFKENPERKLTLCIYCREYWADRTTNHYQHQFRHHRELTGKSLPFVCDRCEWTFPTAKELERHQEKCEPDHEIHEALYNALMAANWAQDLTVQTWDGFLPSNAFVDGPAIWRLPRLAVRKHLADFKQGNSSLDVTCDHVIAEMPTDYVQGIGLENLNKMVKNYLKVTLEAESPVSVQHDDR